MQEVVDLALGHVAILMPGFYSSSSLSREYGPAQGFEPLREAIAAREGVTVDEVAVTTGASLGLVATLATLKRPCSILCPRPYYPAYPKIAGSLGLDVLYYDLERKYGWLPDPDMLERLLRDDTKAILWNFPHNPTGSLPVDNLVNALARIVREAGLLVISDEVYADFVFEGNRMPDVRSACGSRAVVRLKSFSKIFGIPGERLGYVVADPPRLQAIAGAHWSLAMCPPATAQSMALVAIQDCALRIQELRNRLAQARTCGLDILEECGSIRLQAPKAGVFFWIEVIDDSIDSRTLARGCANHAGVMVAPGGAFGVERPVCLRASFAQETDKLVRGFRALTRFLGGTKKHVEID